MRLLNCHIENFGKLHDFDLAFTDGLNVICRENGWGKSTLAAFLKAMLYGLDGDKKRDIDQNERRKFKPWQGGIFGGRLDFEAGDKQYSVTRLFGDTPAKDSFELRDRKTNLISGDYSERLGEELFRLNSASFYRSIFIGQSDCSTAPTDDIHAKIGNLADNTGDLNSFEAADSRLAKQISRISPKLRTGSLHRLSEEIASLRRRVADGSGLTESIAACENDIAENERQKRSLTENRRRLEEEQLRAIRLQKLSAKRGEWERLKKTCGDLQSSLDAAKGRFPAEIPDELAVKRALHAAVECKSAQSLMISYELSAEEEGRLSAFGAVFAKEPPSDAQFNRHLSEEQNLRRIREKYERLRLSQDECDRLRQLTAAFAYDTISPSELASQWVERSNRKNSLTSKQAACAAVTASWMHTRAAAKRKALILMTLGAGLLLTGVGLCGALSVLWGAVMSAAGGILLTVGIISALAEKKRDPSRNIPDELRQLQNEIESDRQFIASADRVTQQYLSAHGMEFNESYVTWQLQELCGDKRDLDELCKKSEIAEQYRRENGADALWESIGGFLRKYRIQPDEGRLSDQLHNLKEYASEYASLSRKKAQFDEARSQYDARLKNIKDFLVSYGFDQPDDMQSALESMRDGVSEYNRLFAEHAAACGQLAEFEQECDPSELASVDAQSLPSLEALSVEISECGEALERLGDSVNLLKQKRDELYKKLSQWESDKCALQEKIQQQTADTLAFERLVKARELLRTAKENMTARYVDPIYSGFRRYHEMLSCLPSDNYRMDANIEVTVDECGRQREIKALSAGFRDLSGICLRLALTDAMFREEKPALIMDDPFINLDDGRTEASKKWLAAVAERYQIIYFTCSSSREIRLAD